MQPESSENSATPNGQGPVKEEKCRGADCFDLNVIKEEEFDQHVVFIVPDAQTEPNCTNRAEASLPRNLVLKPSQALNDVCVLFTKKKKIFFDNILKLYFLKSGIRSVEYWIHTERYKIRAFGGRNIR